MLERHRSAAAAARALLLTTTSGGSLPPPSSRRRMVMLLLPLPAAPLARTRLAGWASTLGRAAAVLVNTALLLELPPLGITAPGAVPAPEAAADCTAVCLPIVTTAAAAAAAVPPQQRAGTRLTLPLLLRGVLQWGRQ